MQHTQACCTFLQKHTRVAQTSRRGCAADPGISPAGLQQKKKETIEEHPRAKERKNVANMLYFQLRMRHTHGHLLPACGESLHVANYLTTPLHA